MKPMEKMKKHYYPRLEEYMETHRILDWESREAQFARFRVLTDNVNLEGKSVLDVGCGCGDLFSMLREDGIEAEYRGVDILPEMIRKARDLHGDKLFICGDIFKDTSVCSEHFDVVFTSGIFNLNLGNNQEFFSNSLSTLSRLAEENLVINLLDESSPGRDDSYFYFNPEKASGELESFGWNVKIIKGYLDNDFTLLGYRS